MPGKMFSGIKRDCNVAKVDQTSRIAKLRVKFSLGNLSKDRQQFVDSFVLISASDRSNRLSHFENFVKTQFKPSLRM